jgi:hypothetical protein
MEQSYTAEAHRAELALLGKQFSFAEVSNRATFDLSGTSPVASVLASGKPVYIQDVKLCAADERFAVADEYGIESVACVLAKLRLDLPRLDSTRLASTRLDSTRLDSHALRWFPLMAGTCPCSAACWSTARAARAGPRRAGSRPRMRSSSLYPTRTLRLVRRPTARATAPGHRAQPPCTAAVCRLA